MKKLLSLSCMIVSALSYAEETTEPGHNTGYSYFSFGMESITYEERLSNAFVAFNREIPFSLRSDGQVSSPTIRTGGLYHITDDFDFSLDSSATFAPTTGDEDWFMTIDLPELGITGTNKVQKNVFTFTDATTTGLLHYKFTPQIRVVAGAEFALHTFKRFEFDILSQLISSDNDFVEETVANINLMTGFAYESGELSKSNSVLSAKALVGVPVWVDVVNSNHPSVPFNEAGGYSVLLEARYTFSVSKGMNLGVFSTYRITERAEQESLIDDSIPVFIPEATTTGLAVGISVVWDL